MAVFNVHMNGTGQTADLIAATWTERCLEKQSGLNIIRGELISIVAIEKVTDQGCCSCTMLHAGVLGDLESDKKAPYHIVSHLDIYTATPSWIEI